MHHPQFDQPVLMYTGFYSGKMARACVFGMACNLWRCIWYCRRCSVCCFLTYYQDLSLSAPPIHTAKPTRFYCKQLEQQTAQWTAGMICSMCYCIAILCRLWLNVALMARSVQGGLGVNIVLDSFPFSVSAVISSRQQPQHFPLSHQANQAHCAPA